MSMLNKRGWGGPHLGVVRSWIQRRARNGDIVTWGSGEHLNLRPVTAGDMDELAEDIATAVIKELIPHLQYAVCLSFTPWGPHPKNGGENANWCKSCGQDRYLHELRTEYRNTV